MGSYLRKLNILLGLIVLLSACQKEEFTEPVKANLVVKLEEGTSSYVSFEYGLVLFEQILFDGHRQQGGDVHFATEPGKTMGPVSCSKVTEGFVKSFDIPQGVYSNMQWHFLFGDIDDMDDETDDEADEPDMEGGIVFSGWYHRSDGSSVAVRIMIEEEEQFIINASSEGSYENITLSAANTYDVQLAFNPYYAIRPISQESWENAELNSDDDQTFIEISTDMNEALYETVLFRLESSVKVVIK